LAPVWLFCWIRLHVCNRGENTSVPTFYVYFPAAEEIVTEVEVKKNEAMPTGNERILVVDDENTITTFYKAVLSYLGYEVTTRTKSQEALDSVPVTASLSPRKRPKR
jgi:PleD family two-component response regulator